MGWHRIIVFISVALLTFVGLTGCTFINQQRTAEEWLSLAYSGLAAMDQYSFTGSMNMGLEEGVMLKPQLFEGKVVNHEQLTIQTEQQDLLYWNPVEVLKMLNHAHASVDIIRDGEVNADGVTTLTLYAQADEAAAKKRWSDVLTRELEKLDGEGILQSKAKGMESKRMLVLEEASRELKAMLATLTVQTDYHILIDKKNIVPLKLEEETTFLYERDGRPIKEKRHTLIRFQAFVGAAK